MNIHQIDEICWIKDAWPVTAHGIGGRAANSTDYGQNLDSLSIEWTFADGTKAYDVVRWLGGHCHSEFATYIHGTKCAAQFNTYGLRKGETTRLYKDQRIEKDTMVWESPPETINSWDAEWNVLLDSIRNDKPQNETKRAAYSNVADLMGRAAVHSGKMITWDEAMASNFQFCPNIDAMDYNTPPPVQADAARTLPRARSRRVVGDVNRILTGQAHEVQVVCPRRVASSPELRDPVGKGETTDGRYCRASCAQREFSVHLECGWRCGGRREPSPPKHKRVSPPPLGAGRALGSFPAFARASPPGRCGNNSRGTAGTWHGVPVNLSNTSGTRNTW